MIDNLRDKEQNGKYWSQTKRQLTQIDVISTKSFEAFFAGLFAELGGAIKGEAGALHGSFDEAKFCREKDLISFSGALEPFT